MQIPQTRLIGDSYIVVNIMGGLGNQMFQFACGHALAKHTGLDVLFSIDSLNAFDKARPLELRSVFGVPLPLATPKDIAGLIGHWRQPVYMRRILARPGAKHIRGRRFITEQDAPPNTDLSASTQAGGYLHGYWQSPKYFEDFSGDIRTAFSFQGDPGHANRALLKRMAATPSIGIHVRRGDYVSNPKARSIHGVLPKAYYLAAIEELRHKWPKAPVFAFTDDPKWVAENLSNKIDNAECITHNTGATSFRDMELMTRCAGLVIANSSFSWWGAWLNSSHHKTIVAPKNWFATARIDASTIVPRDWLKI